MFTFIERQSCMTVIDHVCCVCSRRQGRITTVNLGLEETRRGRMHWKSCPVCVCVFFILEGKQKECELNITNSCRC